jgi:hypothetical protein
MTFTPNVFPTMLNQPLRGLGQILNATGTGQVTIVTAGGNGTKVLNLTATSTDTAAQPVQVSLVRSSTTYILATTSVAAGSGDASGTAPVDLLAIIPNLCHDQDGQPYLFLNSGDTLVVSLTTGSVTSGKVISVHSDNANF